MCTVWHVDKCKITFKLIINWTNEILRYIVVSSGPLQPGVIDARARYQTAAQWSRNTAVDFIGLFGFILPLYKFISSVFLASSSSIKNKVLEKLVGSTDLQNFLI